MQDHTQRMAALKRANAVRAARARLKDRVHADPSWRSLELAILGRGGELVASPPAGFDAGVKVVELLKAAPGIGRGLALRLVAGAGSDFASRSSLTLERLGPRRANALASAVRSARGGRSSEVLERIAGRPRHRQPTTERTP